METLLELFGQYFPMLADKLPFVGTLAGYALAGSGATALALKYAVPALKWISAKTPNTVDDKVAAFLDKLQKSGFLNKLAANPDVQAAAAKAKAKKTKKKKTAKRKTSK